MTSPFSIFSDRRSLKMVDEKQVYMQKFDPRSIIYETTGIQERILVREGEPSGLEALKFYYISQALNSQSNKTTVD